ncbi:MAG: magnesium-translocating P-type ATPase, partial [Acholeplasmataceae bacterium]
MNIKKQNERLIEASRLSKEELFSKYNTSINGLKDLDIVEENRDLYGENIISTKKRTNVFTRIFKALIDPFNMILIILAIVSLFLDVIFAETGEKDPSAIIIIMVMVLVSVFLKVFQETKSEIAVSALTNLINVSTAIKRDNITKEMPLEEVVAGDIIMLAAGDLIPSDARIIYAKDLFLSEASLTGESHPIEKHSGADKSKKEMLDKSNLVFMGTNVISGSGIALSITVGNDTLFGDISKTVTSKQEKSAFEKGLSSVSWLLIRFMLVMIPFVLIINGVMKSDWLGSVLFALSIAVGLTPEMLPMIVTTSLAKGAVSMSKEKVVVKDLSSIQNIGAMNILCTDKTGTLTKNKIVVEYHHNVHGDDEPRVLRHAFLNSYYQTGLRNLIDNSIIDKTNELKEEEATLRDLDKIYTKIDEIPFDFNRKRMSVILEDKNGKVQMVTKGALEEMLSISTYVEYEGKVLKLTDDLKEVVIEHAIELNKRGMRVIAVSQKTSDDLKDLEATVKDENDMVLMGYLSFLDPIKESAHDAIESLEGLGVNVKVLTGDNERVTQEVCRRLKIETGIIVLGSDLAKMSDDEVKEMIPKS